MRWRNHGGQAVLTLRALVRSERFDHAWNLLSDTYRDHVELPENVVGFVRSAQREYQYQTYTQFYGLFRHRRGVLQQRPSLVIPTVPGPSLPVTRAPLALDRPGDVVGHPAAVKAAGLRPHALAVDVAVHAAGIEGKVLAERLESRRRLLVGPGDDVESWIGGEPEVARPALSLAERITGHVHQ